MSDEVESYTKYNNVITIQDNVASRTSAVWERFSVWKLQIKANGKILELQMCFPTSFAELSLFYIHMSDCFEIGATRWLRVN